MSAVSSKPAIPAMDGATAYPRKNGEPVFDAPWQSRAFGMVVGLHTAGLYPWDDFKTRLIAKIGAGACAPAPDASDDYYQQWVDAFWQLLIDKDVVSEREMTERTNAFLSGERQDVY